MTVAVCIKCGAMKTGALSPCDQCGFDPHSDEDKARSVVLSDHHFPDEELARISERIKAGQPVAWPEEAVQRHIESFRENPNIGGASTLFRIGCLAVAIAVIAAIAACAAWVISKKFV